MKKLFRMLIFSAVAIFLTSLWNKGFIISFNWQPFLKAVVTIAVIYYLVVPFSKLILLPLNILTLGLVSFLVYLLALHILSNSLLIITIKDWVLPGLSFNGINIDKLDISYFGNLVLSSLSISFIINTLEQLL